MGIEFLSRYGTPAKRNWFHSLNQALESENLVELWPLGSNIGYCEYQSHIVNDRFISVYRDERGMYERPVHYSTK